MKGKRLAPSRSTKLYSMIGARKKKAPITTMKWVVFLCLLNGFAWVWCSYILAFKDKYQIAESLSQVAITEIIGVVLVYAVKALIENLSKNNQWPDKGGKQLPENIESTSSVDTILTSSGIEVEQASDATISALDYISNDAKI